MYIKKVKGATFALFFIGGSRFTICFKQVLKFFKWLLSRCRLENDQSNYLHLFPYRLTISVWRIITQSCRNVLGTRHSWIWNNFQWIHFFIAIHRNTVRLPILIISVFGLQILKTALSDNRAPMVPMRTPFWIPPRFIS